MHVSVQQSADCYASDSVWHTWRMRNRAHAYYAYAAGAALQLKIQWKNKNSAKLNSIKQSFGHDRCWQNKRVEL